MGTILVVDDDEQVRKLVAHALAPHHRVLEAQDAQCALEILAHTEPDVIVCDVMMPVTNGYDFVRYLRSNGMKHVPVVFLTAKSMPLDVIEGINAGARAYVTKPFKIGPLVERINRIAASVR